MERFLCVHGHFYQPPRENAWLEQIELQDSAYPYHDWNERIAAECYTPNSESRILDNENFITKIVNNYSRISFNFGPTLLSWMERNLPTTYQAIIEADRQSRERFSGHGSAVAQAYNHLIMPLATRRDKATQVTWGLKDFEHRFGRPAEGMWLPETAVDLETLEVLAEHGVTYTILAPRQAARARKAGEEAWTDVSGEKVDPTTAYLQHLPSGRSIVLFFYDGPVAKAIAFEGLLDSGETLAARLIGGFDDSRNWNQLMHVAVDGETFGHHHRFGDMALAYALEHIESGGQARLTNYAEFLQLNPATHEVEIFENTSWSCVHGVERWKSNCGCNTGAHPEWNQEWRAPLRESLDWLRDTVAPVYEQQAGALVKDPWAAREDYVAVVLDRSPESIAAFLEPHVTHPLDDGERVRILKLLELQRHAMLMYTSCGWFFDELSGIETVQVMQYAGRVTQLAQDLVGNGTEEQFLERLAAGKSNIPEQGNGRDIYGRFVKPAMIDLTTVAAHFAVSSLFEQYGEQVKIFCYPVTVEDYRRSELAKELLCVGRATLSSEITTETGQFTFGVLHFGEHNLNGGVRAFENEEAYVATADDLKQAFESADFAEVIRGLDRHFGASTYSLRSLFRDEQRKVMEHILEGTLSGIEQVFRQVYEHNFSAMRFITEMGNPLPKAFKDAAEFIINTDLRRLLSGETCETESIKSLVDNARTWGSELDNAGHGYLLQNVLGRMMTRFVDGPDNIDLLERLIDAVELRLALPFPTDLGEVQTMFYRMLPTTRQEWQTKADGGDEVAKQWMEKFDLLGERLKVRPG
jgi:alpha-amylase/alpha-mannosidase (GH57 family)